MHDETAKPIVPRKFVIVCPQFIIFPSKKTKKKRYTMVPKILGRFNSYWNASLFDYMVNTTY